MPRIATARTEALRVAASSHSNTVSMEFMGWFGWDYLLGEVPWID